MLFCWDPNTDIPFDFFEKDDLPPEVQSWLTRDIADLRHNKFIVPAMGIEKDFSLFSRIQAGTTKNKLAEERDRLTDMFFRSLDNGNTMSQAYRQLMSMTSSTILAEGTPRRKTRNSQVKKISKLSHNYLSFIINLSFSPIQEARSPLYGPTMMIQYRRLLPEPTRPGKHRRCT